MDRSFVLALILASLFAGVFAIDYLGYLNRVGEPIAVVAAVRGTTRRLALHELSWDRATPGTPLSQDDAVSTAANSKARIVFLQGGEAELEPGTMLRVSQHVDALELHFITGKGKVHIPVHRANQLQITYHGERVPKDRPSPIALEVSDTVGLEPSRLAQEQLLPPVPEAQLRDPQHAVQVLSELEKVPAWPQAPELLSPHRSDLLTGDSPITFEWQPSGRPAAKSFELALRPASANRPTHFYKTQSSKLVLPSLAEGDYVWSVRSFAASGAASPAAPYRWLRVRGRVARAPAAIRILPTVVR